MKTLIISDIHGNLAALNAVLAEPHEAVICLGDLVGTGPEPAACIERVRASAFAVVQGNHDRAIADGVAPDGPEPFRSLAAATIPLALAQLDGGALAYLRELPLSLAQNLAGRRGLLVHATPHDPLHRAVGPDPAAWAAELAGVDAELVLVGHTHVPFDLLVESQRVINPGSVGFPMDGDSRAAYAVLEDGAITLRRAVYPIEDTVQVLRRSAMSPEVRDEVIGWVRTGRAPDRRSPLASVPAPSRARGV